MQNISVEYLSVKSIKHELKRLIKNENEMPQEKFYIPIHEIVSLRKTLDFQNAIDMRSSRGVAQIIASVCNETPFDQLRRRAERGEPDASLSLADCYLFGLKGSDQNQKLAYHFYKQAAELNQPEGVTMLAYMCYLQLLKLANMDPDSMQPLPFDTNISNILLFREIKQMMWDLLDHAVDLNWITPFMIKQADEAFRFGTSTISDKMKQILLRRREEANRELEENTRRFTFGCSFPSCTQKTDSASSLKSCARCLNAKYCSKDCQVKHWIEGHKLLCVPAASNPNVLTTNVSTASTASGAASSAGSSGTGSTLNASTLNSINSNESQDTCNQTPNSTKSNRLFKINLENSINIQTSTLNGDFINQIKKKLNPQEQHENQLISRVRLQSFGFANTTSVDQLEKKGDKFFNKRKYAQAVKYFSLAIDKKNIEKPINEMKKKQVLHLARLFEKRIQSNFSIAENNRNLTRYYVLASNDCAFVLDTGIFDMKHLLNSDVYAKLREIQVKVDEILKSLTPLESNNNQRRRRRRATRRQRQRQQANLTQAEQMTSLVETNLKSLELNGYGKLKAVLCSKLADSCLSKAMQEKLAKNAEIEEDTCPICFTQWTKYIEPSSLAVILPCKHACCVKCMLNFHSICLKSQLDENEEFDGNESCSFCVLCRDEFSPSYLNEIAESILEQNLFESFRIMASKLPFNSKQERDELIESLLIRNQFDIDKVDDVLFNMYGLIYTQEQLTDYELKEDVSSKSVFDSNEKQEYFELARAPVNKFNKEYLELKSQIAQSIDRDDFNESQWIEKERELRRVQLELGKARENAANDIFERMNTLGKNTGFGVNDERGDLAKLVHFDLHGLFKKEAIEKIEEYVLPVLNVCKKIVLITGHGSHNKTGEPILKDALKQYFASNSSINCEEISSNKGALCIYFIDKQ